IKTHDKKALSRISKNAKQDQGVALDIQMRSYINVTQYLQQHPAHARIIALDSINNPQNLGMILRSCAAGNIDAVIVPKKGSAKISPLVIKASAGALFKTTIIYSETLDEALKAFKKEDFTLYNLSLDSRQSLFETKPAQKSIFVLGNESEGVSKEINALCDASLIIPMNNEVESLNVAVTASLIAFLPTV
ncbi:MAG: RNA methyltransferase, partial [Thiovulaceae bacterium]|nr:RNA methyltransferase [Sulfurimonadaceae bacterium]